MELICPKKKTSIFCHSWILCYAVVYQYVSKQWLSFWVSSRVFFIGWGGVGWVKGYHVHYRVIYIYNEVIAISFNYSMQVLLLWKT